nr:isoleucyl-tRNA synthetase [Paratrimastix eleionoma]
MLFWSMSTTTTPAVPVATATTPAQEEQDRHSFPDEEAKILQYWKSIDAFGQQLKRTEGCPEYSFYDGPPFATGLPHYGHILAGTIKDVVTRYWSMMGYHIVRRFGWDTHGVPVEYEIDRSLGIKCRADVINGIGIAAYNAECRKIVMRYSSEWRTIVERMGRWIDFDNDYKTLNPTYMESVWWVFKQVFDKGLVYRGVKVMPFSTAIGTPLSNFEATQNYKEATDPTVIASFPLREDPNVAFVAWTTTPWTLPSNLALCVNPTLDYVTIRDKPSGKQYILAEARLEELYKKGKQQDYEVLSKCKGIELKGKHYIPLFDYFANKPELPNVHQVICDTYVTATDGTGIVHIAPYFGEDDNRAALASGIIAKEGPVVCPVDDSGKFTAEVTDFAGIYVKDADKMIIHKLKSQGRVVSIGTTVHQYPYCYRSDTPLIYRAVPSWFIDVPKVKENLLANNDLTHWVPDWVKEKRFHNWLADCREWAVSRNRFWGTPIPLWVSEDFSEIKCIGSIEELERLSGQKVTDLHRDHVDDITIPSEQGNGRLHRVDEVFDCWFESGSMPYAQNHYPFENVDLFNKSFPADFIAEGVDQTRGWFYTLMVLSTVLFNKPAFKNLVVNGLVLAGDGKKMSKRLRNFPDPMVIVNQHGADAVRLFLVNSPVVHGENLRFKAEGVQAIVKEVFLPWMNAHRFFTQNASRFTKEVGSLIRDLHLCQGSQNAMDKWILATSSSLLEFVHTEMKAYRLYTVVPRLLTFIDDLTNWYVRFNRKRLKGAAGVEEWRLSLSILLEILFTLCTAMAPFTPFLTEFMYQRLMPYLPASEQLASVHFHTIPQPQPLSEEDKHIAEAVSRMQTVVLLGRSIREKNHIPLKNPLRSLTILHPDLHFREDIASLQKYIQHEMGVHEVIVREPGDLIQWRCEGDNKRLGQRLKGEMGKIKKAIQEMTVEQILSFQATGTVTLCGQVLDHEDVKVMCSLKQEDAHIKTASEGNVIVMLNTDVDEELVQESIAHYLCNRVQKLRKTCGLLIEDTIEAFVEIGVPPPATFGVEHHVMTSNQAVQLGLLPDGVTLGAHASAATAPIAARASSDEVHKIELALHNQASYVEATLLTPMLPSTQIPAHAVALGDVIDQVGGVWCKVTIIRATPNFPAGPVFPTTPALDEATKKFILTLPYNTLRSKAPIHGCFGLEGQETRCLDLVHGTHWYLSTAEKMKAEGKPFF